MAVSENGNSHQTIWCNISLTPANSELLNSQLPEGFSVLSESGPDNLAEADIAFGQPPTEEVIALSRLHWVHLSSAGYTSYDTEAVRQALKGRGAVMTNSSHVYDAPCAQHAAAMILANARQLPQAIMSQMADRDWQTGTRRRYSFLLNGQTVLLLGFGAIAEQLTPILAALEMRIIGFRRNPKGEEPVEMVTEEGLDDALAIADHVVNILPESPSTRGFMNGERFARMKPGSFFYNIGRGATVDQDVLFEALSYGHLAAAYLDVTSPEPLPSNHPLWTAPNCFITPHTAGGHGNEQERLVRHFLKNVQLFAEGKPLENRVI